MGEGVLGIASAEVCQEAFVWEANALVDRFAEDLEQALNAFLHDTFHPWARSCMSHDGKPCVAWLVCNSGEAYSFSKPIVEFGRKQDAEGVDLAFLTDWKSTLIVIDSAKSSDDDVAMDVFSLKKAEPRRLVFDLRCKS